MNSRHLNKLAEHIADKVGSPISIAVHTFLFVVNLALMFVMDVDRVLLILTTWVSLEAIYLALFTQLVITNAKKEKK